MGGISYNPDRSDVDESSVTSAVLTVGTTAVELFTGASRNASRQVLTIYNDSNNTIYVGPSTVTISGATKGMPIVKGQFISLPIGNVGYFAIAGLAGNNVILTELS